MYIYYKHTYEYLSIGVLLTAYMWKVEILKKQKCLISKQSVNRFVLVKATICEFIYIYMYLHMCLWVSLLIGLFALSSGKYSLHANKVAQMITNVNNKLKLEYEHASIHTDLHVCYVYINTVLYTRTGILNYLFCRVL